jgi:hypothetical protein
MESGELLKTSKFHMKEVKANLKKWLNDPKYRMDRSSVYEMFTEHFLDSLNEPSSENIRR